MNYVFVLSLTKWSYFSSLQFGNTLLQFESKYSELYYTSNRKIFKNTNNSGVL